MPLLYFIHDSGKRYCLNILIGAGKSGKEKKSKNNKNKIKE